MVPLFHFITQKLERSDSWRSLRGTIMPLWDRVLTTKLITYSDSSSTAALQGAVGLINTSNTCYFNATLQAIASCDHFIIYLENIVSVGKQLGIRPRLSSLLLHCMLILRSRKSAYVDSNIGNYNSKNPCNPQNILQEILRHDETFVIGVQHDADELMRKLLEILSEEEMQVKQHLASKEIILDDLKNSNRHLSYDSQLDLSIPISVEKGDSNPFLGLFCKQLQCCKCDHTKQVSHELFTILPLLIPCPNSLENCTLNDCLDYFMAPEIISQVICNACSVIETIKHVQNKMSIFEPRRQQKSEYNQQFLDAKIVLDNLTSNYTMGDSDVHIVDLDELEPLQKNRHYVQEKRMDVRKHNVLSRLPGTICIGIGRKSYNEHGLQIKLKQHVVFTETIDITKYFTKYSNKKEIAAIYELVSLVVHHGSAQGGHYTNFSLINGKWFHFSDTLIHEVKREEVLRAQAYMLFYKKKSE